MAETQVPENGRALNSCPQTTPTPERQIANSIYDLNEYLSMLHMPLTSFLDVVDQDADPNSMAFALSGLLEHVQMQFENLARVIVRDLGPLYLHVPSGAAKYASCKPKEAFLAARSDRAVNVGAPLDKASDHFICGARVHTARIVLDPPRREGA